LITPILEKEAEEYTKKLAVLSRMRVKKIDKKLRPVKELKNLWRR